MTDTPRWAVLSGIAGLAGNALLILFFALDRPWAAAPAGYEWLGPANDALVVVQFAALIPVAVAVRAWLGLGRGTTAAAVTAMAEVVVLQLALLAGLLAFDVQVLGVVACFAVVFGWVLVVSRAGWAALPPRVVRLGFVVGAAFLAGLVVAAAGLLAAPDSVARYVAWGLAGWPGWSAIWGCRCGRWRWPAGCRPGRRRWRARCRGWRDDRGDRRSGGPGRAGRSAAHAGGAAGAGGAALAAHHRAADARRHVPRRGRRRAGPARDQRERRVRAGCVPAGRRDRLRLEGPRAQVAAVGLARARAGRAGADRARLRERGGDPRAARRVGRGDADPADRVVVPRERRGRPGHEPVETPAAGGGRAGGAGRGELRVARAARRGGADRRADAQPCPAARTVRRAAADPAGGPPGALGRVGRLLRDHAAGGVGGAAAGPAHADPGLRRDLPRPDAGEPQRTAHGRDPPQRAGRADGRAPARRPHPGRQRRVTRPTSSCRRTGT